MGIRPDLAFPVLWILTGLLIRLASLSWNDRLHGDVNLFALTAREFIENGRLDYPMKYEFSDRVEYEALHSPASQHPPVWPLTAGVLGRALGVDETFALLKGLSFFSGMLLLLGVAWRAGRSDHGDAWRLALPLMAFSPLLVDYAANGSMYGALAVAMVLATLLLARFDGASPRHAIGSGVLCSLALQTHGAAALLPFVFGVRYLRDRAWRGLFFFAFTGVAVASPWMVWNLLHFGSPLYSYTATFLLLKLGLLADGVAAGRIGRIPAGTFDADVLLRYFGMIGHNLEVLAGACWDELGPFCLALAAAGVGALNRSAPPVARAGLWVHGSFLVTTLFWGAFRLNRFLVPLLPGIFALAGAGAAACLRRGGAPAAAGALCFAASLAWMIPAYLESPRTRYYPADAGHERAYRAMLPLAHGLATLDPGVVLGWSNSLDGGIETVYWHRLPFVYGRLHGVDLSRAERELRILVRDFDVRYVWADQTTRELVHTVYPDAQVRLENGSYAVLELRSRVPRP